MEKRRRAPLKQVPTNKVAGKGGRALKAEEGKRLQPGTLSLRCISARDDGEDQIVVGEKREEVAETANELHALVCKLVEIQGRIGMY